MKWLGSDQWRGRAMIEASQSSARSGAGAHGADVQHLDSSVTSYTSYTDCRLCARSATVWTVGLVEERLRKAAELASALSDGAKPLIREITSRPTPKTTGIIGGIGGIEVGPSEAGAEDDDVVAMAAEALSWLPWLQPDDAGIVRARLEGASWKMICWRFDVSRPTADRRWRYALALIAWHLNGNATSSRTPSLRSMLGLRRAA